MAADAAPGGVFLPVDSGAAPNGFNQLITFYPKGVSADAETVNAVVIKDDEEGTREVRGDGVTLNERNGRAVRRSVKVECNVSVLVRDTQTEQTPDMFVIDGEVWPVKRILGRDLYMQTVLCVHRENVSVRNENRVG